MSNDDASFVREVRSTLSLTQVQLATELGVTERMISMYENGDAALPAGRRRHLELLLRAKRKR